MGKKCKNKQKVDTELIDSSMLNSLTQQDYLKRLTKLALSIFEWVNLPSSMNEEFLEKSLFYKGMATLLFDEKYGFINTNCSTDGYSNIYNLPTSFNCYSNEYSVTRQLYTGLLDVEKQRNNNCILVQNNIDRISTFSSIQLFAYRLANAENIAYININAQKTPILLLIDEAQRVTIENLYSQYEGNKPFIFGDKNNLSPDIIRTIKTDAPFIADKIIDYKKEIWNDALTFLGINNIIVDKKERLITDEANSNNELINLNLQSFLAPRKLACKQFNELFGFTNNPDKAIDVRVRSDLHNVIKNTQSIITDFQNDLTNLTDEGDVK